MRVGCAKTVESPLTTTKGTVAGPRRLDRHVVVGRKYAAQSPQMLLIGQELALDIALGSYVPTTALHIPGQPIKLRTYCPALPSQCKRRCFHRCCTQYEETIRPSEMARIA